MSSNVFRRYHGKVLVIIDDGGIQHGFVFEPGQVDLSYVAADGSHPRDLRRMDMSIEGTGRMAAIHELPGGVQDGHEQQDSINPQGQGDSQGHQALEP